MTLIKRHIVENVSGSTGLSHSQAHRAVTSVIEIIKETLLSGEDVVVSAFGKFTIKRRPGQRGWDFQRQRDLSLNSRKTVTFKCSQKLRERINETSKT